MDYNETELRATKKINKVLQDLNKPQPDLENIISLSHTEIMQPGNIKITNLVKNSMDKIKVNFLDIGATSSSLDDLIARFKALSTLQSWHLGRANFLLSLIEDAVCKVQTKQANPGEVNIY